VKKFDISLKSLREVERLLTAEFAKGLESEGEDVKVKMLVTHVHEMPKGTEEGEFLVLNLGVDHLRVLHISELTYYMIHNQGLFQDFSQEGANTKQQI
jgi:hexokinase